MSRRRTSFAFRSPTSIEAPMFDFVRKHTRMMQFDAVPADLSVVRAVRPGGLQPLQRKRRARSPRSTAARSRRPSGTQAHRRRSSACASRCPRSTRSCSTRRQRATQRWSAGARPRAASPRPRLHLDVSDQRLSALMLQRTAVRVAARPRRQLDNATRCSAPGHVARDVRAAAAPGLSPRARCWPASSGTGFAPPAQAAAALNALLRAARGAGASASTPQDYARQGQADRCRARGLLQGATQRCSRRPSRRASNTWCSTSTR